MTIWRVGEDGPKKIDETRLKDEKVLEQQLEDWIEKDPSLLGEPLFIVGRQVRVADVRDRLDLLAIDPQGNTVIVELKRGDLSDPVDMQAMRYASYISKWDFEQLEREARAYRGGDPDFSLKDALVSFYEEAGVEEPTDVNREQRLVIAGSAVREKLGSVALWLREHNIDITVIEVKVFSDNGALLIQPNVIIPLPVSRFAETGKMHSESIAWTDGKAWHLEERCSSMTKDILLKLDAILQKLGLEPRWNQQRYVAYRLGNYVWLSVHTGPGLLVVNVNVKTGSFGADELAERLQIAKFDREETLAEKLGLPSSVIITPRGAGTDRVRIRMKSDFNLDSEQFLTFLQDARQASAH